MTRLEGLGCLTRGPQTLPNPPPTPLPAVQGPQRWLGAVWLFSDEPRVDKALSSLWQMVRAVSANVNMQLVGKQRLPALNILHSLLAFHRKGMEHMPSREGYRAEDSHSHTSLVL